jgi:undecaprenyl-diphosphatase
MDLWLLHQINLVWGVPWLDGPMAVVSSFGLFKIPLVMAVLALAVWGGFRERALLVLMTLCLLIGDAGINWTIKRHVNRPRPHESISGLRVVDVGTVRLSQAGESRGGNSFTSGHACNNVALALVVTLLYGMRLGGPAWLWAALVSYSRIYTASHYPSDILGSWLISPLYTLAICYSAAWLWRKNGARWFPVVWPQHPDLFPPRRSSSSPRS